MASVSERLELIKRNLQEVVTEEELAEVLSSPRPISYMGIEPSGPAHLGTLMMAGKAEDLIEAGFHFKLLLADWHAFINDKFEGDMERIRSCGEYLIHFFKALGVGKEGGIEFVWASDVVDTSTYWEKVIRIAKASSLQRLRRAMTIMGRREEEADLDSSKFFYPAMQAADIFHLEVDAALGGIDQRKAHMLARDAAEKLGWKKPVALHTPLIPALNLSGRMDGDVLSIKMSKSDPDSGILIHDSPEDIRRKLKKAYCPEGEVENNPVLDIARYIVFRWKGELRVLRPEKWGGDVRYTTYKELESDFRERKLHPLDLKNSVADALIEVLDPLWRYFESHPKVMSWLSK